MLMFRHFLRVHEDIVYDAMIKGYKIGIHSRQSECRGATYWIRVPQRNRTIGCIIRSTIVNVQGGTVACIRILQIIACDNPESTGR